MRNYTHFRRLNRFSVSVPNPLHSEAKTSVGGVSDADFAMHHHMRAIAHRDRRLETPPTEVLGKTQRPQPAPTKPRAAKNTCGSRLPVLLTSHVK